MHGRTADRAFSLPLRSLRNGGCFEMFGFKGVSFYLIAVSISYAASGYYGLYKDQTIVYSKYKAKYINKHTKM